jgi:hypothetical protein
LRGQTKIAWWPAGAVVDPVEVDPVGRQEKFDELMARVAKRFTRAAGRARSWKGCWPACRARTAGQSPSTPGTQHLLSRAVWEADEVRDAVVKRLGDVEAMLVVDETGDVKKGVRTVGVQRPFTGTAWGIENAQLGGVCGLYRQGEAHADRS